MIYIVDHNLWQDGKEATVKTELGDVVIRLEDKSGMLSTRILVYDRYHVEIGTIKKKGFSKYHYDIYYDDRVVGVLKKKRGLFSKRLALETTEGATFQIKGKIEQNEYRLVRRGKTYAEVSHKLAHQPGQFGLKTKDERLKYTFLCVAVALTQ